MSKRNEYNATNRYTVGTREGNLVIELVGRQPASEPYLWIGEQDIYLDSIEGDDLRMLAWAINDALGPPASLPQDEGDDQ